MPGSGQEADRVQWWLCSHLVSIAVPGTDANTEVSPALLEEISATGVRFVLHAPLLEATTVVLQADDIERRIVVEQCRVRADDFQIEARFADGFRWTPDEWTPDHLYLPRPKAQARGAAGA